ncbi:hypothetical protein BROOK1789B_157 [Bathymodiolus brooksi thiotrophic gill symbiont]|nr:hypothetical protein BROOK1789B_157 [Bathymodiolus brooksi thiotrophic gill symbiont]
MVSCAAFGCNNRGTKGNGLSFFSFPKDGQLRKAWIHYCRRWNFDPTSGHRLCSTHFTRDCFERDPLRMMELGVDGTFKRRLKPDAAPNVPLASPDPEKKNGETPVVQHLHIRRGALQKRQKAEVCDF